MTWKIDMGMYSVFTDSNIQQILEYGRSAAEFVNVTDTDGEHVMLNVRNIITIREAKDDDQAMVLDNLTQGLADLGFSIMNGGRKPPQKTETIVINEEEDE